MIFPAVTAAYAAVLALMFFGLSIWVIAGRTSARVIHGDGGNDGLNRRIRAHGNFAEYVPIILIVAGLLEAAGESRFVVGVLLGFLVLARIMHPIGMVARENSVQQFAFRAPGAVVTFGVLIVSAVLLLFRLL